MSAKKFRLIYLSEDLTKKVELTFTRTKVAIIGAAIVFSCLLANLFISLLVSQFFLGYRVSTLKAEEQVLKGQLTGLGGRLDHAEKNLASLAQTDDFLRLLANLPALGRDIRQVGVGGGASDMPAPSSTSHDMQAALWTLEKVEREIQLQMASFQEISSRLLANQEMLDHTPSLRPVEGGYVSSGFGYRRDPFTGRTDMHPGVDIPQKAGTPVVATGAGQVIYADRYHSYGKLVVIDHGNGYETVYGHLQIIHVKAGELVQKGQQIGTLGATGRATAPHIHYEVRVAGKPVDPLDYFFDELAALPGQ
ncbi:MAG: peptidoglycan DD-metalloendopeptidase family protein [bacterium]